MLVLDAYTDEADLKEHLMYFNTKIVINGATETVKYKMLPSTLRNLAMTWVYHSTTKIYNQFLRIVDLGVEKDN